MDTIGKFSEQYDFLSNFYVSLDWQAHPMWENKVNRDKQRQLIELYVKNSQNYMNASDDSSNWPIFLEFNDILDKKKNSILDIYPHWDKYIK